MLAVLSWVSLPGRLGLTGCFGFGSAGGGGCVGIKMSLAFWGDFSVVTPRGREGGGGGGGGGGSVMLALDWRGDDGRGSLSSSRLTLLAAGRLPFGASTT